MKLHVLVVHVSLILLYLLNRQHFYVELAANELFGAGDGYQIAPTRMDRTFTIFQAQLVLKDPEIYQLLMNFQVLVGMTKVCLVVVMWLYSMLICGYVVIQWAFCRGYVVISSSFVALQ